MFPGAAASVSCTCHRRGMRCRGCRLRPCRRRRRSDRIRRRRARRQSRSIWPSATGARRIPPSVVFQMPPPVAPGNGRSEAAKECGDGRGASPAKGSMDRQWMSRRGLGGFWARQKAGRSITSGSRRRIRSNFNRPAPTENKPCRERAEEMLPGVSAERKRRVNRGVELLRNFRQRVALRSLATVRERRDGSEQDRNREHRDKLHEHIRPEIAGELPPENTRDSGSE